LNINGFPMTILAHYGELALKGRNRRIFENKLIENIKKACDGRIRRLEGRIVVQGSEPECLKDVFGISWFAPCFSVEKDISAIKNALMEMKGVRVESGKSFGVFVKRADKSFPYSSLEIAKTVGDEILKKYKLRVDLNNPELPIYIEIADEVFIYFEKHEGLGGLPVGISGRVLSLLSGGIDSPVASYMMMKRGCQVDYVHFHTFPANETVLETKIKDILKVLNRYGFESRIYLAPYHPFQLAMLGKKLDSGYELVMFRRFMVRVAEKIAETNNYLALITGDSLGQVASQTLENLKTVKMGVSAPILQPLISFDKDEIVTIARKIGSYDLSIKPYKDCCSLIAKSPRTKSRVEHIRNLEQRLDIKNVVAKTLELVEVYEF
jgi:thiamine biosynthesis protein ThiI